MKIRRQYYRNLIKVTDYFRLSYIMGFPGALCVRRSMVFDVFMKKKKKKKSFSFLQCPIMSDRLNFLFHYIIISLTITVDSRYLELAYLE